MGALLELIQGAWLAVAAAAIDIDRWVVQSLCMMPAACLAVLVAAAWIFLPGQPNRHDR